MSDDEREIDVESDEDGGGDINNMPADKRAHHNALERKRRDHIKESFIGLRDAIPTLQGDKSSRAQILKKASEYISFMRRKNTSHNKDIDDLKRQNQHLEAQIRALEGAKTNGNFTSAAEVLQSHGLTDDPASTGSATFVAESPPSGANGGSFDVQVVDRELSLSGSDSDPGNGSILVTPNPVSVRSIQPGQSLLLTSSSEGPARKKFKQ